MMRINVLLAFMVLVLPMFVVMMGIVTHAYASSIEIDSVVDDNKEIYERRVKDLTERGV